MANSLTCRELVELVSHYLDGALPRDDRLAFEQHVAICPPCRGYLAEIRRTMKIAGELTEENISPDARDALLEVFHAWNEERSADP